MRLEALDGELTKCAMLCCWGKNLWIKLLSHIVQNRREKKVVYTHSTAH